MRINGSQVVTGMYVYNPDYEFTVNDFVISDGVIYTCTQDVKGEDPETSESFTVYLGDRGRAINLPEYLNFLETSEGENKYLSVGMLQAIMSYYLLGPTGKGIIGDYIYYDPEGLRVSLRNQNEGVFTNPDTVISDIMFHPDINHALLRVSRFLPEINGFVGFSGISEFSGEDQRSVILRQYTYIQEETEDRIRLQELIDPVDGVIWYRSSNLDTKTGISSGSWKCSVVNSRSLKAKAEDIINLYTSRLKVLKSIETSLKSNFRYKKLGLIGKPTSLFFQPNSEDLTQEITLTISKLSPEGFIKTYETTINMGDKIDDKIPSYLIGEEYKISSTLSGDGYNISLLDKVTGLVPERVWFSGAYYKEYYGLS